MTEDPVTEPVEVDWGWDAHERAQRRRFADAPLADKIAWLEEAQQMVLTLARQRSDETGNSTGDRGDG
jgi:hypothetical protein